MITSEMIKAHATKQRVPYEIAQRQLEYAARPFFVLWIDSHRWCETAVPWRFTTFDAAFEYVQAQWSRIKNTVTQERYNASDLRHSRIEGPGFKWSLRDLLLAEDVSSY